MSGTSSTASRRPSPTLRQRRATWRAGGAASPGAWLGYAAMAGIMLWWTWRALQDPSQYDLTLLYQGGQLAWATGHPEHHPLWVGTPLLAAVMAVITRVMSLQTAGALITILNLGLVVGVVAVLLRRLRGRLPPVWWWLTAFALVSFAPMMSTVWWKQLNIIALVLALAGFDRLERGRTRSASAMIGLSVAVKPLVFLLPLVLLARRETRRAGALSLAWVPALTMAGQALLALHAGDLGVLSPLPAIQNFLVKSKPGRGLACQSLNFAPQSLVCRVAGPEHWLLQRTVVSVAIGLLGLWVIYALRRRRATSWEAFAFVCLLSVMFSPVAWAHYQVMLAPLFVLLVVGFAREGAGFGSWAGLATAFLLASLMWQPYGTLTGTVANALSGHAGTLARSQQDADSIAPVAQFAQYVLLITGLRWYAAPGSQD